MIKALVTVTGKDRYKSGVMEYKKMSLQFTIVLHILISFIGHFEPMHVSIM